jgi:hypothetical protein
MHADNNPMVKICRCVHVYNVSIHLLATSHLPTFFELGDNKAVSVGVLGVRVPRPLRRPVS